MEQEQTYIRGFNHGFTLAKFQPELLSKLKESIKGESDYEQGILDGVKEFEKEKEKDRTTELSQIRENKNHIKLSEKNR